MDSKKALATIEEARSGGKYIAKSRTEELILIKAMRHLWEDNSEIYIANIKLE